MYRQTLYHFVICSLPKKKILRIIEDSLDLYKAEKSVYMDLESYHCLNCGKKKVAIKSFCSNCGQKNLGGIQTVITLISDFFTNIFNLESKALKTLIHFWKPGFLAKEYISGKRKQYMNPIRFFLVCLFIQLAAGAYLIKDLRFDMFDEILGGEVTKSDLLVEFDSIAAQYIVDAPETIDSIRENLFKNVKYPDQDTLSQLGSVGFINDYDILKIDFVKLSGDSLIQKYNITNKLDAITIRQCQKIANSPDGMIKTLIANMLWVAIIMVFIGAFVMMLLYIRHKIFYVEHYILILYAHAFSFLAGTIEIVIMIFTMNISNGITINYFFLAGAIYLWISMKLYYKQGIFKTTIKFLAFSFVYMVILVFIILGVGFVSVYIF